nr:hypothetical protein [Tanacetum cinerariifolium]
YSIPLRHAFLGVLHFGSSSKAEKDGIFISHDKYVAEILRKFGLKDGKSASIPIDTEKPLLKDPDGEDVDVHTYRSMIGSLMYLTSSRPNIMFAVCACARFQVTPKASHIHVVKRIFRYLKGKLHLGLWYPKDSPFELVAYSNSDYAGASLDRKSTIGGCQFLGCRLISWRCKKQIVMATLSTEAEYVAAASCVNTHRSDEDRLELMELIVFLLPSDEKVGIEVYAVDLQFWTTVAVKKVNDITRLQALVDKKKVVVTKATIRDALRLDDAEGVECLPNEEIFTEKQVGDLSTHTTKYTSPALTQKVFANMRRVGKGFSRVETSLFKGMVVAQEVGEGVADEVHDEGIHAVGIVTEGVVSAAEDRLKRVRLAQRIDTSDDTMMDDVSNQGRMIADIDADADVVLEEAKDVAADAKDDQDADVQVLSMQEEDLEPTELQEVVDIVTTAKIITEVVTAASITITTADVPIPAATTAAALILTAAPSRRTKGVGKGILVEEPKPLKKQVQIGQNEKYARELEAELNRTIDWDEVIDHVNKKAKEDKTVKKYQAMKRKPQTEAQERKNMMVYQKNVAGFKMDYFKGMTYDDIRPVFEKHFDSNIAFLQKIKEQINKEESRALKRINETPAEKATKRKKLDEELILLAERRHPLTRFTLDHMLNNVRLEVKEESKVSLELLRIEFSKLERETTYQVTLDALKLSPCFPTFLITVTVLEVYMHQFRNTIKKIKDTDAYRFKLDKQKFRIDTEDFCEILHICRRLPNQDFVEPPSEEEMVPFIKELEYTGKCDMLSEIHKDHMHHP